MNALGREIKQGEKVVLKAEIFRHEYKELQWRTVEVIGDSFGNSPYTSGTAIYCRHQDGEEVRYSGLDIDVVETKKLTQNLDNIDTRDETIASQATTIKELREASQKLGLAVYNLFDDMSKDHSIDIGSREQELRDTYNALALIVDK